LTIWYVIEVYIDFPYVKGVEQIIHLQSALGVYLREKWQTNLVNGIINPELKLIHIPLAKAFAQKWKDRVELYMSRTL